MSPSAEPANVAADAQALAIAERLEDGEIILLAVKPSRWFVLLVSWQVIAVVIAVAVAIWLAGQWRGAAVDEGTVGLICLAVACSRVTVGCFQWVGRLYVLTNRRVMRFHGVFREDFQHCPLRNLCGIHLAATWPERLLGVGTLLFRRDEHCPGGEAHWTHLAQPKEVERLVRQAWSQAR